MPTGGALVRSRGCHSAHRRGANSDATQPSGVGVVDAAVSSWVAEECYPVLGQELTEDAGKLHADLAREAGERELGAWK